MSLLLFVLQLCTFIIIYKCIRVYQSTPVNQMYFSGAKSTLVYKMYPNIPDVSYSIILVYLVYSYLNVSDLPRIMFPFNMH